jgi:hypothetical protein
MKIDESLRKEMNVLVVGQLPSMTKAIGSILTTRKMKLNKIKQTKKK